jgi:DNA-binding PadR family transcriptional regulator
MATGYLGEFEQLILLSVLRLEDAAYGATIRRAIEARTGRQIAIGSIYTTLERLEGKGYVRSHMGEPTAERGGRRRKLYDLTKDGRAALATAYETWNAMTHGLEPKLEAL